ncbi:hypothetical protein P9139_06575 [Curtobacterium flaccumfaciens]|nr:hypothetical protein P9139_06575 [Curtobacterium flaccumfaciens]
MLMLTAGATAAAVGFILQHAAAAQTDTFRPVTRSTVDIAHHTLMVGSTWMWSGALATLTGVALLIYALRRTR